MNQREIENIANEKRVNKMTIDKDWILGHFLNAMYSIEEVQQNFVFKGGICLKKCYIEDYRFSEDLDFTLLDKTFVIEKGRKNKRAWNSSLGNHLPEHKLPDFDEAYRLIKSFIEKILIS